MSWYTILALAMVLLLPTGMAIGWWVHGRLNAPPIVTHKERFTAAERDCMAAEMAEGGTTRDDMVQILTVIVNNKEGKGRPSQPTLRDKARMPCEAFVAYTHMRAPSHEDLAAGVRTVDCALSRGIYAFALGICTGDARRSRAALAQSIVDELHASGKIPATKEPILACATKYARLAGANTARTDKDKMQAELGERNILSTGLTAFCPK